MISAMNLSDKGLRLIMAFEGCRLHVYEDVKGLATIGVGHLLKPGEQIGLHCTIPVSVDVVAYRHRQKRAA
jgi:GH24 family phage-related lysozyme (muramidase)